MKREGGAEIHPELLQSKKNHFSLKHKLFDCFLLALLIFLSFQLSGCMLVGYGAGAIAEAASEKYYPIPADTELILLKPGTDIKLHLKSGDAIKGKCISFVRVPTEGYADLYARAKDLFKDEVALPALGEKITIIKQTGTWLRPEFSRMEDAEFLGFDYGGIRVWEISRPQPTFLAFDSIKSLSDQEGNVLNTDFMRRLVSEQKVPFLSSAKIRLKSRYGEARIDLSDVSLIGVKSQRIRTALFAVGLTVDVLLEIMYPLIHIWPIFTLHGGDIF